MTSTLDATQVNEVRHMLASLGYRNASAEDIALTLQHVMEASRRLATPQSPRPPSPRPGGSAHEASVSPPRGANDVTMTPQDEGGRAGERSDGGERCSTSAPTRQRPAVSAHFTRKGRRQASEGHSNRDHSGPYGPVAGNGGVVGERPSPPMDRERRGRRHVDPVGGSDGARMKNAVVVSTDVDRMRGGQSHGPYPTMVDYMNPQARLERHLKRYEKGLKTLYVNRDDEDRQAGPLNEGEYEGRYADADADTELDGNEESENDLILCYGDHFQRPMIPDMPLRPTRVLLNQRCANTIYSFTGDSRYKYRGGLGLPLCAILGPNGSTLRQRADPVRRGQQMREIWERDKFLAQHRRKEDRWCAH